jgi:hypothetical protein
MAFFTYRTGLKSLVLFVTLAVLHASSFGQQSVARQWSETQLSCIRKYFAKPTVHARHLSHVSIAMYDAWAVYDDEAQPYLLGQTWGGFNCPFNGIPMPADGNLQAAQEKAISYAAYRTLWNRYTIFAPGANLLTIQGWDMTQQSPLPIILTVTRLNSGTTSLQSCRSLPCRMVQTNKATTPTCNTNPSMVSCNRPFPATRA